MPGGHPGPGLTQVGRHKVHIPLGDQGPVSGKEIHIVFHQVPVLRAQQRRVRGSKEGVELNVSANAAQTLRQGFIHGIGPVGPAGGNHRISVPHQLRCLGRRHPARLVIPSPVPAAAAAPGRRQFRHGRSPFPFFYIPRYCIPFFCPLQRHLVQKIHLFLKKTLLHPAFLRAILGPLVESNFRRCHFAKTQSQTPGIHASGK